MLWIVKKVLIEIYRMSLFSMDMRFFVCCLLSLVDDSCWRLGSMVFRDFINVIDLFVIII